MADNFQQLIFLNRVILLFVVTSLHPSLCIAQNVASQALSTVPFDFREEQPPRTYIGNVGVVSKLATLLTESQFALLKFSAPDSKYFYIDEKSGALTSALKIDREVVCDSLPVCKLSADVIVYTKLNSGDFDLLKVITVDVEILDINDNSPKFPEDTVSLSIPESNNPSEELPTSGAVDKDTGVNSVQQYSFKDPTDTFALSVHKNGDGSSYLGIIAKGALDREVRNFYQVTVVATDGGTPQRSGAVIINITVSDINDNQPEFEQSSYNQSVPENVALKVPIMKVHATDKDEGKNAEISYQFSSRVPNKIRQKFTIDEQTGEISAQGNIDYEEDKLFQFIVEAVDHGTPQFSARTNVNLYVVDKNDNCPQISINLPPMGTEVSENEAVGKFIAQVFALDADSGNNGLVVCSMDDDHFSLEKFNDNSSNMYKIVLANPLDYERASSLRVTITCVDKGAPPLSNSTTFVVNVLDINDNRPVFTQEIYYVAVPENRDVVEDILQIEAHDWDSGDFGKVSYSIEDKYNGVFTINPTSGKLRVTQALDREYISKYDFHVVARDNGPERLSSSALVVVTVDDENDEPPRFPNPVYFGDILENQPPGTFVGNATAKDPDAPENSKLLYSILQLGVDYSNFSIDQITGVIKSTTTFDREEKDRYSFMIKVVDPTVPQFFSTCNFTVRILDDNDHDPVIHLSVEENSTIIVQSSTQVGYIITNIFAYDDDEAKSQHSDLIFLIQEGDPYQLFNLNRFSGSLSLARIITARDIKTYNLVIMVQDGGDPPRVDTKSLSIKINGTIPLVSDGSLSQNILIVIILVGVTAVMALVILITIVLIRRIDSQRRKNRTSQKNVEEKMYQLKQQDIFTNLSVNMADEAMTNNLNMRGRKEVSFSLEEDIDSHNTSNGSTQPLTSFKGGFDKKDLFASNKLTGPSSGKLSNGMMNIPIYPDTQGNSRRSPTRHDKGQFNDMTKKPPEDAVSQTSEETDPSDSGRGGSEDDSSHRGSGLDPEHNGSKLPYQIYHRGAHAPADSKARHQLYHQQRLSLHPPKSGRQISAPATKDTLYRQPPISQRSPHSSVTSDFESDFSGDRSSQSRSDIEKSLPMNHYIQTLGNPGNSVATANQTLPFTQRSRNATADWSNRPTNPQNFNSNNNTALMRSFHGQSNRFPGPHPLSSLSSEGLAHPNADRSYASNADRAYKSSDRSYPSSARTNTQSSLTDDDRTTTSGSYTLHPEDLRREIDSMIVRDSVV